MGISSLSSSQQDALLMAAQTCATFSLIGSSFILLCYARYPFLRKLSFTLVLWLAIADIGADVTYFMGNPVDNRAACIAQGSLQQFFQMAQILWTVAIACVLHEVTVNLRMYHPHEQKSLMRRFHLRVWGAALVTMLLPFTTGSYGSTGSWCWIKTNYTGNVDVGTMWRYLVLYCPLWAAIVFNIVVYIRIVGIVRRFSIGIAGGALGQPTVGPSAEQQTRMAKFVKRLMWYPAVLIGSWTFATINRIQNAADPDNPKFGLFFLHTSLVGLQGFMNALVYGSTDAVREAAGQETLVKICRKGRGGGADSGFGAGSTRATDEVDPEDEQNSDGLRMANLRRNEATDDSLGGFGDVSTEAPSFGSTGSVGGGGDARVSGSELRIPSGATDDDDVEVYDASRYTVSV